MPELDPRTPTRQELASFLPTQRLIRAFESLFRIIPETTNDLGSELDETVVNVGTAAAIGGAALDLATRTAERARSTEVLVWLST